MNSIKEQTPYTDSRGREYYFDNAKFLLILSVVVAHAISPLKTNLPAVRTLWTVINAVHMPCLIFISGYFAKGYIKKDGTVKLQRLFTYVVYYTAAQIAVSLFEYYVLMDKGIQKSYFYPRSSLWYLMCLIAWYLILPYVDKIKPEIVMTCSIIFGLLVGYDTGVGIFVSMCRIVNHFPFFIAGYYFKKEWFFKFRNWKTQIFAFLSLIGITVWTFFNLDKITPRIITSTDNYANCKLIFFTDTYLQWVNRLLYYILAFAMCCFVLLLVPRVKTFFTRFGSRTLQVYLLHRFLYLAELKFGWFEPFLSNKGALAMAIIAIILTFILSLKIFEYPFIALGKIKVDWFLKKSEN